MKSMLHRIGTDLLNLIAPAICPSCANALGEDERFYCSVCRASLEPAPFPREIYSEVVGHLGADDLALSAIGSLYSFRRESPVQRLIHALKYQGCRELGIEMGRELGESLAMFTDFLHVDAIVPVPLHHARRKERGYNQSVAIAAGLSSVMTGVEVMPCLTRTRHTPSQTSLGATSRRSNVHEAFRVLGSHVRDRVILLCDDVCTTGATLNACAETLLASGARRVIGATLAKDVLTDQTQAASLPI